MRSPLHLSSMAYACFALAKDILTGNRTVVLTDLADSDILSTRADK